MSEVLAADRRYRWIRTLVITFFIMGGIVGIVEIEDLRYRAAVAEERDVVTSARIDEVMKELEKHEQPYSLTFTGTSGRQYTCTRALPFNTQKPSYACTVNP